MLIINSTIQHPPQLRLAMIANTILGPQYEVTLNYIGPQRAQTLNQTTRGKSYIPNVLSFPLTDTAGELYLCPAAAKREAADFDLSEKGYLTYLFIHGCLHLQGLEHGKHMDTLEARYCDEFKVT